MPVRTCVRDFLDKCILFFFFLLRFPPLSSLDTTSYLDIHMTCGQIFPAETRYDV